jgi:hypothetical protein
MFWQVLVPVIVKEEFHTDVCLIFLNVTETELFESTTKIKRSTVNDNQFLAANLISIVK